MVKHRIIDFHTHLGDIFHENQNIVFKRPGSVRHPESFDPFQDLEESGFTRPLIVPDQEAQNILIDAGQYRTWDRGSIFAHQAIMDACGGNYFMVSLPILPNTSFDEALAASKLEPRIIPFTCCDYGLPIDKMLEKLKRDIRLGAKGLKLHPIIQNVPLDDERTIEACKLFGEAGLPITTHCGVNDYYRPDSPHLSKTNLNNGHIDHILRWLERFPDYILVPAHGGGCCGGEMEIMGEAVRVHGWKNVYTDTSHRGVEYILKAIELFGEDRVLYATDWPFDTCTCNVKCHIEALGNNPDLLDKVFFRNANRLLHLF